jgi:hypothetical protein
MEDVMEENKEVKPEVKPELENQSIPYARFKEVNERAKLLEAELTQFKTAQEKQKLEAAEQKAKEENNYSELKKMAAEKESAIKLKEEKLKEKVAETVLTALAVKEGILSPKYLNLFETDVEVTDDLEITNMTNVEDAFKKFKLENPTLFNSVKPPLPKVDNTKNKEVNSKIKLSPYEKMVSGLQK